VLPIGPADGSGWLGEKFRSRGFECGTFRHRRAIDRRFVLELREQLQRHRIDVVHSHEFTIGVYGAAAAGTLGLRHELTMHGAMYFASSWLRRLAMQFAVAIAFILGCGAGPKCLPDLTAPIRIGSRTSISPSCSLLTHFGPVSMFGNSLAIDALPYGKPARFIKHLDQN